MAKSDNSGHNRDDNDSIEMNKEYSATIALHMNQEEFDKFTQHWITGPLIGEVVGGRWDGLQVQYRPA